MDRIYQDDNGHVWYAVLSENGRNSSRRIFSDNGEEQRFLAYLGDNPANYSIHVLNQLYCDYKRMLGK